jgi:hypothetical protein
MARDRAGSGREIPKVTMKPERYLVGRLLSRP